MDEKAVNKKNEILINEKNKEEHEEILEKKDSQKVEEKIEEQYDDFQGYSKIAKFQLFILFFFSRYNKSSRNNLSYDWCSSFSI